MKLNIDEIVDLYRQHQSARKVAGLVGCSAKTVLERLKEANEPRLTVGGLPVELKYPADKLAAAESLDYKSGDDALMSMSQAGKRSTEIAEALKETTATNIRSRLRYLKQIEATSSTTCGNG